MFLFSLFPTTVASIYMFGNKQACIDFITEIPIGRFWLFGIPFILITYAASVGLIYLALHIGLGPEKQAKPLSIDDPNLGSKLAKLYN